MLAVRFSMSNRLRFGDDVTELERWADCEASSTVACKGEAGRVGSESDESSSSPRRVSVSLYIAMIATALKNSQVGTQKVEKEGGSAAHAMVKASALIYHCCL
eukprot:m.22683 g.22683  ORF g.22683 m.22683 type:complete len:103 (+) comp11283_c0_seq1:1040-1348(+)